MSVKVYKSTDTGAPTLSGTAGHLINVLNGCLVDGYNTQAVTSITRTSNTATVTTTGSHGFLTGDYIAISGADQADYNGNFYITVTGATTFTYEVANSPVTPATGTISSKKAPAGWTKPYTGTNKAAYLAGAGSNGFYLRVDDSTAQYGLHRGYETMSDVDTGTNPFPTVAQMASGVYMHKSDAASTATRPWVLVATEKAFFIYSQYTNTTNTTSSGFSFFGDITSYKSGDAYNTLIFGDSSTTPVSASAVLATTMTQVSGAHYLARGYSQTGSSINVAKHTDATKTSGNSSMGGAGMTYPNGPDAGLYVGPIWITEPTGSGHVRGRLGGLWCPGHSRSALVTGGVNNYDTFTGAGDAAGKSFIVIILGSSNIAVLETSNTW